MGLRLTTEPSPVWPERVNVTGIPYDAIAVVNGRRCLDWRSLVHDGYRFFV